jgi:hypothetical protein
MLKRLRPILEENRTLPDYQFGFRQEHSSIEQVHRITEIIRRTLGKKKVLFCGFPRYHTDLLIKIRKNSSMHATEHHNQI